MRVVIKKLACLTALILYLVSPALAADLTPAISVLPGTTVEVGEEVVFNAEGTTYTPDQTWVRKGVYGWNFGDGYAFQPTLLTGQSPWNGTVQPSGISAVHYFMKPGTYTVTLRADLWASYNLVTGAPTAITSVSSSTHTISAGGSHTFIIEPGKNFTVGGQITFFSVNYPGKFVGCDKSPGGITAYNSTTGEITFTANYSVGAGITDNSWTVKGTPIVGDAYGSTTTTITVTGKEPIAGFEVQHAPFHNRTKQWLYIQIPAAYRAGTTQLKLSLINTTTSVTTVLQTKSNLAAEETYLLDHTVLTAGNDYVLQAELLDASNARIVVGVTEGIWRDKFTKPAVAPDTTIDENNSFTWKGNLFFPIVTFELDKGWIPYYVADSYQNGWILYGYWSSYTPADYLMYVNYWESVAPTYATIGPGRGDYAYGGGNFKRNILLSRLTEHINIAKDNTSMFQTHVYDEPNMGGMAVKAYPPTIAAWEYTLHAADPSHPHYVGWNGADWFTPTVPTSFDYQGSQYLFGGKKWVPTSTANDVFPFTIGARIGYETHMDKTTEGPISAYYAAKEKMRAWSSPASKYATWTALDYDARGFDYATYKELIPMQACVKPSVNIINDHNLNGDGFDAVYNYDDHTIGLGAHTFAMEPFMMFFAGQKIVINRFSMATYKYTHVMKGTVTSYDATTGSLVVDITEAVGSGTYNRWQIIAEYPVQATNEVYNMAWLEFIHGAKGADWFTYFADQSNKWSEMKKFTTYMADLQSKLLTAVPARTITRTDKANDKLDRVDTLIREKDGITYIVASRLTEPPPLRNRCLVILTGTPTTVISNGKVRDTNNVIWDLPASVTIGANGTAYAWAVSETLGRLNLPVAGTLTTIATPTAGWNTVTNAYFLVALTGTAGTVITNGKIKDSLGNLWDLPASVTLLAGTTYSYVVSETPGQSAASGTLNIIHTPVSGWTAVTNTTAIAAYGSRYTGVEPATITPTFTISGLTGSKTVTVYGESRTIASTDGVFSDEFDLNETHIYTVVSGTETPDTTAPTLNNATIESNGTSWTFSFSEPVACSPTSDCCDAYTAAMTTVGAVTLSYASGTGTSSVVCTGNKTVYSGDTVANGGIDYTQPGNGIEDAAGNDLVTFIDKAVTNNSTQVAVTTPPVLYNLSPSGNIVYEMSTVELSLLTNVAATCRYHATSTTWADMTQMSTTGGVTEHLQSVSAAVGANSFKVKCQGADLAESEASTWSFTRDAQVTATLKLTVGEGVALVTSSPAGINCGTTCEYPFSKGGDVYLTTSCLTGWYGEDYNIDFPGFVSDAGRVTMDENKDITAFCINGRAATLGSSGGSVTVGSSGGSVTLGP